MPNNTLGFNYYNVDTDRYQDIKIKRLKKEFRCDGVAVYDHILNEIYRVKGCFLEWDESTVFEVADYWGLKETQVKEIVNYCCHVGLFNKRLLSSESIITSLSIQARFLKWSRLSKRVNAKIPEKYRLIPEEIAKPPEEVPKLPEENDEVKRSKLVVIEENVRVLDYFKTLRNYRQLGEKYKVSIDAKFFEFYDEKVDFGEFKGKPDAEIVKHFSYWLPKNLLINADYEARKAKQYINGAAIDRPRKKIDHSNLPI